jgi:hypothetical protein
MLLRGFYFPTSLTSVLIKSIALSIEICEEEVYAALSRSLNRHSVSLYNLFPLPEEEYNLSTVLSFRLESKIKTCKPEL